MRITGGTYGGRPLAAPKSDAIRPTSDRVREALFSIVASHPCAPPLEGARVIDLFAGTGALGLEAVSRGATQAILVDMSAAARGLIRENIERLGLEGRARLLRRDATKLGKALPRDVSDIAFIDPPYGKQLGERTLVALRDGNWLEPGAFVVLEERTGETIAPPASFTALDTRVYGDTALHFFAFEPARVT